MKRIALIVGAIVAAVAFVAAVPAGGDDDDSYLVRAVFDNGSFVVPDEDVRIAGANVGHVEDVDVSLPGEVVSREPGEEVQPGKAIVVLEITDPAFQNFRQDASCILRPQSLIGERYVNCRPTIPRADPADAPPPLEQIPEGEPGEGQYLLPVENNSTSVDIDLIQNIQRRPVADRFRIILNELGIGLAARGEDIAEIVERSNPTLREINRVLEILADQRRRLTQLAADSERILEPLAEARRSVAGFFDNAGEAAAASADHRAAMEEALAKFPVFLEELKATMADFESFSTAALPVARQLGVAAPPLTEATELLPRFLRGSTTALTTFGDAAEGAGPKFADADPVVRRARNLARTGVRPTRDLNLFLGSTRRTKGFEWLMELIYYTAGSTNEFDEAGHFLRTSLAPTNCVDYVPGFQTDCQARFLGSKSRGKPVTDYPGITPEVVDPEAGGTTTAAAASAASTGGLAADPDASAGDAEDRFEPTATSTAGTAAVARRDRNGMKHLLEFLTER